MPTHDVIRVDNRQRQETGLKTSVAFIANKVKRNGQKSLQYFAQTVTDNIFIFYIILDPHVMLNHKSPLNCHLTFISSGDLNPRSSFTFLIHIFTPVNDSKGSVWFVCMFARLRDFESLVVNEQQAQLDYWKNLPSSIGMSTLLEQFSI